MIITVTEYNNGGIVADIAYPTLNKNAYIVCTPGFGWAHSWPSKEPLSNGHLIKRVLKALGSDTAQFVQNPALVGYISLIKESGELRTYTIDVDLRHKC